jgi:outer membrane protein TolC
LARRVALNVQRTLLGEDPGTFPVTFSRGERMTFNMATARAMQFSPPWGFLTQMDVLYGEPAGLPRQLSLAQAVREAVQANLDVQAADRFVAAGQETIHEARGELLPQVTAVARGRIIDADRANIGAPERTVTGSLELLQLLYSEPTWANLSIQRSLQSSREQERQITLLDVVLDATTSYLNVLSSKTAERIRRDNLNLTRTNLELAQVRRSVGVARPNEVLRWESQIANDRRDVINVFAQRQQAEIGLNRVLHRPLEEPFTTEEPSLDDPQLLTNFARILPYVDNPRYFAIFREFMVQEGLEAAPELQQAGAEIVAQERVWLSSKRSFYTPTVSLQGNVSGIEREGVGRANNPDDHLNWQVGVEASLPLYTGGSRVARRHRAREELAQLQRQREAAAERIAASIRMAMYEAGSSYANIELAQEAAAAARENLELVTDAYGRGAVSILDLVDAQREALSANLDAANTVYVYLIDLMHMQRAVGQFDFFVSVRGRKAWFERLDAFFRSNGVSVEKRK